MQSQPKHDRRSFWTQALVLVLLAALAYLPLVFQLGYYHDDWFTAASRVSGVSLFQMHRVDRPMMGVVYTAVYALLGDAPLGWHLFAFLLRAAGGVVFLWLLWMIWPGKSLAALTAAVLFTVYPGFLLQPSANNYQNHLLALLLGLLSLALMVRAFQLPHGLPRWLLLGFSAALILVYPMIYEALIGLEAMRLVLLGYLLPARPGLNIRGKFSRLLRVDLPYLLAAAVFFIWRFLIFKSARTSTDAVLLLQKYRAQPLQMLARLVFETGRDFVESVFLAWTVPFYRLTSSAGYLPLFISLLLALAAAVLLFWLWFRRPARPAAAEDDRAWSRGVLLVGALSVLLTLLPVILSDRDVQYNYNLDRYTLQSIPAVAVLVTGLIFAFLRPRARYLALVFLVGLSLVTHYQNAVSYRAYWQAERQFWWQLSWRAPDLKDDTALVAVLPANTALAEGFEIWAPANLIYRPGESRIAVTGVVLNAETARQIAHQESFGVKNRTIEYTVDSKNALIASMPGMGTCLHVIDGRRVELPGSETAQVRAVARFSNLDLIRADVQPKTPPAAIFGAEPPHGWCYYYQRAELARQQQNWAVVANLGDEAAQAGLTPNDVSEWMPFYEAYARMGRIEDANHLGGLIRSNTAVQTDLCDQYNPAVSLDPIRPASKIEEYIISNLCAR